MSIINCLRIVKNFPKVFIQDIQWTYFQLRWSRLISSKESKLAEIFVVSHVLEKGLTMPDRHLGFGQPRIKMLTDMLDSFINIYGSEFVQVQCALNDLAEYLYVHKVASYKLPDDIVNRIQKLLEYRKSIEETTNLYSTAKEYFVNDVDFNKFAYSRRSLRYYANTEVEMDRLLRAIRLAQTAPSACNRQATRVKILQSKESKEYVLSIQHGSRGFGHLADKILLITSDMSNWAPIDRNAAFLDAGIFTMNLLYALHYNNIGACPLNAEMNFATLKELHKVLNIPSSEIPICFITIGNIPEEFRIAKSERLKTEDIYTVL